MPIVGEDIDVTILRLALSWGRSANAIRPYRIIA